MAEFNDRILPMFNDQLEGKLYFCGQVITGYDLQVFCEINSIKIIAEKTGYHLNVDAQPHVLKWQRNISLIQEVQQKEQEFQIKVNKVLEDGL